MENKKTLKRIRVLLLFFISSLMLSGLTAMPVKWELNLLCRISWLPQELHNYLLHIKQILDPIPSEILYGFDWLAFAHIIIGIFFIGVLSDPVKNKWVIEAGMIACLLVFPLALFCGSIRGVPVFWRLIDCSFGVLGIIPLYLVRNMIRKIENYETINYQEKINQTSASHEKTGIRFL